jgi:antitoxin component of MazEF toxin-antitoxin module
MKLELKMIGNWTGHILPKELLARLGLERGDSLTVSESPDRTLTLSNYSDDDETMRIARRVMKDCKNTLKALAK